MGRESKLAERLQKDKELWDDAHILRYLRARKFSVKDTIVMLEASLNWRENEYPKIKFDKNYFALQYGVYFMLPSPDISGRAVVYLRVENQFAQLQDNDLFFSMMLELLEEGLKRMKKLGKNEKVVVLFDLTNYPRANSN